MVIAECDAQGVKISHLEAAMLLRDQMPEDAHVLSQIIEGEIIEEPKGLLSA